MGLEFIRFDDTKTRIKNFLEVRFNVTLSSQSGILYYTKIPHVPRGKLFRPLEHDAAVDDGHDGLSVGSSQLLLCGIPWGMQAF